jgi:CRP-like cAMP-binding protein
VPNTLNTLFMRLESLCPVSPDVRDCVFELHGEVRHFEPGQEVVQDGERPNYCAMVLSGFVCRYKMLPAGTRQIMSFHLPGDIPDLQSLFLRTMDHSIGVLTASEM